MKKFSTAAVSVVVLFLLVFSLSACDDTGTEKVYYITGDIEIQDNPFELINVETYEDYDYEISLGENNSITLSYMRLEREADDNIYYAHFGSSVTTYRSDAQYMILEGGSFGDGYVVLEHYAGTIYFYYYIDNILVYTAEYENYD